jgi:hypothetical protein
MSSSAFPYGIIASSGPTLSVSPQANGDSNIRFDLTCYAGVQFNTSGVEYEYTAAGAATVSQGNWLDEGSASDVWVERTITAGSFNSIDPGTGRHQLSTTRSFRVIRTIIGVQSCTASFEMFDAASGGNSLATTSSAVWSAEYDSFGGCPFCCFTPDTLITMASGIQLPIRDIKEGDEILVLDPLTEKTYAEPVREVIIRTRRKMYKVTMEDGRELHMSDDHPVSVPGKGFSSINPEFEYKDMGIPEKLEVGDKIGSLDGVCPRVQSIEFAEYLARVYTFSNSYFFANGMLVY